MTKTTDIEMISIDITNRCHKRCPFCYNSSNPEGHTEWTCREIVDFARDCVANGVKAISLGGGEPFEHPEIFDIIDALYPIVYLSVTSNGLPLLLPHNREKLRQSKPDKIHLSLHFPDNDSELNRIIDQIQWIEALGIKSGVNLLVTRPGLDAARAAYAKLREYLGPDRIILLPVRYGDTPTPDEMASVTGGQPFQCASCLLQCKRPDNFASISWDKCVNSCSFAGGKVKLQGLSFQALTDALRSVSFKPCYRT